MRHIIFIFLLLALLAMACVSPAWAVTPVPTVQPTLTKVPTVAKTLPTVAQVTATRSLNVRQHPSERARVLGYLYHDEAVTLTGTCQAGWAQIQWKDSTAWVNADYLSANPCQD